MKYININAFKEVYNPNKRLLGLDISKKRFGVAISSHNNTIALPKMIIHRTKLVKDTQTITELYNNYNCQVIIVGLPIKLDTSHGTQAQSVQDITTEIQLQNQELNFLFTSEVFTTKMALAVNENSNKNNVDDLAASIILNSILQQL